jgi:hypothetical protein
MKLRKRKRAAVLAGDASAEVDEVLRREDERIRRLKEENEEKSPGTEVQEGVKAEKEKEKEAGVVPEGLMRVDGLEGLFRIPSPPALPSGEGWDWFVMSDEEVGDEQDVGMSGRAVTREDWSESSEEDEGEDDE